MLLCDECWSDSVLTIEIFVWEKTGDTLYWHQKNAQGQSAQHYYANIGLGDDACDPSNTAHVTEARRKDKGTSWSHRPTRTLQTLAQNADTSAHKHQDTAEFQQTMQMLTRKRRTEREQKLRE